MWFYKYEEKDNKWSFINKKEIKKSSKGKYFKK